MPLTVAPVLDEWFSASSVDTSCRHPVLSIHRVQHVLCRLRVGEAESRGTILGYDVGKSSQVTGDTVAEGKKVEDAQWNTNREGRQRSRHCMQADQLVSNGPIAKWSLFQHRFCSLLAWRGSAP